MWPIGDILPDLSSWLSWPQESVTSLSTDDASNSVAASSSTTSPCEVNASSLDASCNCRSFHSTGEGSQSQPIPTRMSERQVVRTPSPPTAPSEAPLACQLKIGGLDKSFLVREECIEVYRNSKDGLSASDTSIPLQFGATSRNPHKTILHDKERYLLLLKPGAPDRKSVFQMDLASNKVVSEWKFTKDHVDMHTVDITTISKSSQMEVERTFLGLHNKCISFWDTRTCEGMVEASKPVALTYSSGSKQYVSKWKFKCMAPTGGGDVVAVADDGIIRLYDKRKMGTSVSNIEELKGVEINAIDVSYNGNWILATTDKCVMVFHAGFSLQKNKQNTNGFKENVKRYIGSCPFCKLKLLQKDLDTSNDEGLRSARFSWITEPGDLERRIVASSDKFSVVWDFRVVESLFKSEADDSNCKVCTEYMLSEKKLDQVVESAFMHENAGSRHLVVATSRDVFSCVVEMED